MRKLWMVVLGLLVGSLVPMSAASAATASPTVRTPCTDKETYYVFQYNDSNRLDKGCVDGNEVDRSVNPNLQAVNLHVSCSDSFVGGVGQKSDLGKASRRVVAWKIVKGGGKKVCGVGNPRVIPMGGIVGGSIALAAGAGFVVFRRRRLHAGELATI